ncbi:AraC family transcriptional regulator [Stieleria maiorica]|nr:AraC family transcriptional regulator [Stieleria maiorica]
MNACLMNPLQSDPVTELLAKLYLPQWQAAVWHLQPPWGLEVPDGVVSMYVVIRGGGWLVPCRSGSRSPETSPIRVVSGDHLITTDGSPHRLLREPNADTEPVAERLSDSIWPLVPAAHDATTLLYAQFELTDPLINPLAIGLPDLVHLNHRRDQDLKSCVPLIDLVHQTTMDAEPGWQLMVRKLAELVFIRTIATELRRNARCIDGDGQSRLLRAMTDTVIGPVLKQLIESPQQPWSVPAMAQQAKVSKSAFSDRFRNLLGRAPLQYLTELRMQKARQLLRETSVEISHVATLVGYESPSSFSSVFRRWNQCSPAEFRRGRD